MTTTEALAQSQNQPIAFIKGSNGIDGWYGKIFFKGRTEYVRHQGQWNYDSRERAVKATKRYLTILTEAGLNPA